MEAQVSATLFAVLTIGWIGLTAVAPKPVAPHEGLSALSALETAFSEDPHNVVTASRLAATYIELRRPALAIALIRSVGPRLLDDPQLSHQLARAYEAVDRIPDALGTANLAFARCARAIDSSCSEGTLASLERHRNALGHMNAWGVQDTRDHRTALAYQIAERRVSLASFSEP